MYCTNTWLSVALRRGFVAAELQAERGRTSDGEKSIIAVVRFGMYREQREIGGGQPDRCSPVPIFDRPSAVAS